MLLIVPRPDRVRTASESELGSGSGENVAAAQSDHATHPQCISIQAESHTVTEQRRLPDLICLGAQKAATTWLYDQLNGCGGIFVPAIKELHYFSGLHYPLAKMYSDCHRQSQVEEALGYWRGVTDEHPAKVSKIAQCEHLASEPVDDDWYAGIFAFAHPEQPCVDVAPDYLTMPPDGASHLLSLCPDVKVLVILRDPIDRMWSHMRMVMTDERVREIVDARRFDVVLDHFIEFTQYNRALTMWREMVPHGRLLEMLYDDVSEDPSGSLDRICEHGGLTPSFGFPAIDRRSHVGRVASIPPELHTELLRRLRPQYEFLMADYPKAGTWLELHERAAGCQPT